PIATANKICKLPITAQPISSSNRAVVCAGSKLEAISSAFPSDIIIPATVITATTTINALPNFCQNSKEKIGKRYKNDIQKPLSIVYTKMYNIYEAQSFALNLI